MYQWGSGTKRGPASSENCSSENMYLHWRHEGNSGSASYLGNQLARCDSVPDKAYTPERSAARRTSWIYWQFFCNPAWSHYPPHLLSPLKERLAERSNKPSQTFFLTHSWPVCYHRIPCDLQRCTAHALPVNESHKFTPEASLSMPVAIFFDTSWHKRTAGSLGCAMTPSIFLCTKHVTWTCLMIDWTRAGALAALALDCTWTNDTKRPWALLIWHELETRKTSRVSCFGSAFSQNRPTWALSVESGR